MNDSPDLQRERLSAFVDGETTAEEQRYLAEELLGNAELRAQLRRYQRISSSLQGQQADPVDASRIAQAVSDALIDEPTVLAPRRQRFNLPRVALGGALAAGVAVVTLSVAPGLLEPESTGESPPQTFAFSPNLSVPTFPTMPASFGDYLTVANQPDNPGERWKTISPEMRQRLDNYLIEHNEYAGRLGLSAANAHVGFVSTRDD